MDEKHHIHLLDHFAQDELQADESNSMQKLYDAYRELKKEVAAIKY